MAGTEYTVEKLLVDDYNDGDVNDNDGDDGDDDDTVNADVV